MQLGSEEELQRAISELNGQEFNGKKLKIDQAQERREKETYSRHRRSSEEGDEDEEDFE